MIRSHRITHRRLFPLLAVLALVLSVSALALRPAVPVSSSASAPLYQSLGFSSAPLSASRSARVMVNGHPVLLGYQQEPLGQPMLLIQPQHIQSEAQVQVLWTGGDATTDETLPSAVFLGQLSGASALALPLPSDFSADRPGQLVFRSLPLAKTLGTIDLAALPSNLFQESR